MSVWQYTYSSAYIRACDMTTVRVVVWVSDYSLCDGMGIRHLATQITLQSGTIKAIKKTHFYMRPLCQLKLNSSLLHCWESERVSSYKTPANPHVIQVPYHQNLFFGFLSKHYNIIQSISIHRIGSSSEDIII